MRRSLLLIPLLALAPALASALPVALSTSSASLGGSTYNPARDASGNDALTFGGEVFGNETTFRFDSDSALGATLDNPDSPHFGVDLGVVITPAPEPATLLLLSTGLAGLAWSGKPRR